MADNLGGGVWLQWDVPALTAALEGPDAMVMSELFRIGNRVRNRAVYLLTDRMVNVRSGRLRGSMVAALGTLDGGPAVIVGTDVVYGIHVHEGSRGGKARPFLTTALDDIAGSL